MTDIQQNTSNILPIKKERIRLLFPYSENPVVKKLGAKYDPDNKIWYYPAIDGKLPEDLQKYKCHYVEIEYDDKEYFKNYLPSMKFDKLRKMWMVNQEDYLKFVKLNVPSC